MKSRNTKLDNASFVLLRTLQVTVADKVKELEGKYGVENLLFSPNWYATMICSNLNMIERALVINGVIRSKRGLKHYSEKIDFVAKMFERQFAKVKQSNKAVAA